MSSKKVVKYVPDFGTKGSRYLICAMVDQLPLFPYNRGETHQPNFVGVYRAHCKDCVIKGGGLPSPTKRDNLDHGTYSGS